LYEFHLFPFASSFQAGPEMRKNIMHVLYQQSVVVKPEHLIESSLEPSAEFLQDMELLYGSTAPNEENQKDGPEIFPPVGTKEAFLFDPRQLQEGLQIHDAHTTSTYHHHHYALHAQHSHGHTVENEAAHDEIPNTCVSYVARGMVSPHVEACPLFECASKVSR